MTEGNQGLEHVEKLEKDDAEAGLYFQILLTRSQSLSYILLCV